MEVIKNISLGIFYGAWDSIRGMVILLHIDDEIHRLNTEKEAERQRRLFERQRRMRRSPSPVPISASAMERERQVQKQNTRDSPDERSLESIRRKRKSEEEKQPQAEKKIAKKVLKCCLLNGGFTWLSIVLFEKLLLPTIKFVLTLLYGEHSQDLHMIWGWLQSILSIIFGMMWVLPIFLLSKIVSSLWFADIATAAYQVRKGRPQTISSISKFAADFLFSVLVQALFLVQSMLVSLVPYVGDALCFLHLCLLYSLYSFEYKWFNMGWELHRRLSYIENNWPYFFGFGIPLTVLTSMTNSLVVSSCIFSIFFPLFILSGNEAKPLVETTDTPLRLFSPVIFVSNLFFNRSGRATQMMKAAQQKQQIVQQQQQEEKRQQMLLQQQMKWNEESRNYREPQQSQTHRYQQPPLHPQIPQVTRPVGRYSGGMRPLIPTPVPGAPSAPIFSQR